jgi:serine/threonine-protein kinase
MIPLENAPVSEGEILDGKYRVDRVIGVGGMGVVVAATHVQLNTQVALKFLLPDVLSDSKIVERFVREARSAVQIQSEHVARVSDVGTLPNGAPYMVMEYLEGQDLANTLAKSGTMAVERAVGYVLQACEAIAEAHSLGIIHRDLKPANLFLVQRHRREPIVKVLDFGISKSNDAASLNLTKTASLMGSPYYMSPEQMRSARDADARSDIWAIGVILFELLSGTPPFQGETITELVVSVTQGKVPSVCDLRPDVPAGIADVIACCLQRDPKKRYADIGELAKELVPFGPPRSDVSMERISRILGAISVSGRPLAPDATGESAEAHEKPTLQGTAAAWSNSQGSSRATRNWPIFVAAAAIISTAALAVIVWRVSTRLSPAAASNAPAISVSLPPQAIASTQPLVTAPPAQSSLPVRIALASAAPESSAVIPPALVKAPPKRAAVTPKSASNKPAGPAGPATPAPVNRGLSMGMKE